MSQVRVRFAPSPTGFLHVGGARTAIFNWLYARRSGGVFVLRIEDTDRERSSEPMVATILEGMDWLGMTPDDGPHFQSRAQDRHLADAAALLESGHAYRCFCDADDIHSQRQEAETSGTGYVYPGTCRELSENDASRRADSGEPYAVRFHVPDGNVHWDDLVHGPTAFDNARIDDFVIVRSDGTPTYMLSVVSDDIAMRITHVVRGDDHLSNTPKQILLYRALGHHPPAFAHMPLILGEDRKRLSKRHGAVSVLEYREQGFLPEAMFNFLSLLGWSPGDDRQKLSRDELVESFDLSGVGRAGAVFDHTKLKWLNGLYIDDLPIDRLEHEVRPRLEAAGLWRAEYAASRREWFRAVLALLQPRARTLQYFVDQGRPYFDEFEEFEYDDKAVRKHLKGEVVANLRALRERLAALPEWTPEAMERTLRTLADDIGLSAGRLIHPTRLAVTGKGESPGIFEVLELVGRERSLGRIDRLVRFVEQRPGG